MVFTCFLLFFMGILNILSSEIKPCELTSKVTSINNSGKESTFDLYLTITIEENQENEDCEVGCSIKKFEDSDEFKKGDMIESYFFSNRRYYFFNFNNLNQFVDYLYECESSNKNSKRIHSEVVKFKFPKHKTSTKIAVFGDWALNDDGKKTMGYLEKYNQNFDSIIVLGDLSYDLDKNEGEIGNNFLNFVTTVSKRTPFMLTPGNHEKKENYLHYFKRFYMPNKNYTGNLYYSFDINDVHIISIPSDYVLFSDMVPTEKFKIFIDWIKSDLQNTNKKWKIVVLHRPLYCSYLETDPTCFSESNKIKKILEDIFYLFKIDLVISGHLHNYERLYPIYKNHVDKESISSDKATYTDPKYPVYVICGAGGSFRKQANYIPNSGKSFFVSNKTSICDISVQDNNLIVSGIAVDDSTIFDSFTILKKNLNSNFFTRILTNEDKIENKKENQKPELSSEDIKDGGSELLGDKQAISTVNKSEVKTTNSTENTQEKQTNQTGKVTEDKVSDKITDIKEGDNKIKSSEDKVDPTNQQISNNTQTTTSSSEQTDLDPKKESTKKHDEENDVHHQYNSEDKMAEKAFYLTVVFLTIFILLFIYNLIRCYNRIPTTEKPVDVRGYSRELQHQGAIEDDSVLDLTT